MSESPPPVTKIIEYKILATCARCNYKDSIYNKHEYTTGQAPQQRTLMFRCTKCDKDNIFHYTVDDSFV